MTDKEAFVLIAAHAVPGTEADAGPLSRLRYKLRMAFTDGTFVSTYGLQRRMAEVLEAPEWMQAAEEANVLRSQLEHWKTFAVHAEGEHAAWKKTATELDEELRALRNPAPLVAWITEGGCECLQRGEGPVRVMPEEDHGAGFTVPLYARERPVSDEPQSAVAAAYGGLTQTAQG